MSKTNIDTFIDDLIIQKGFTYLTPELRKEIAHDVRERLDEYIMARSLAQLSENELTQIKQLLAEKKTRAELQQFAMDHIPDYQSFLVNTIAQFREAYLS